MCCAKNTTSSRMPRTGRGVAVMAAYARRRGVCPFPITGIPCAAILVSHGVPTTTEKGAAARVVRHVARRWRAAAAPHTTSLVVRAVVHTRR
eukprot:4102802-Prymnesium_polylepis.1